MNIKEYRDKELPAYVIALCVVILYLSGCFSFENMTVEHDSIELFIAITESVFYSSVDSVFVLIFDGIISSENKERVVFLWKKLPGFTVFSDLRDEKTRDNRFTKEEVVNTYQNIYEKLGSIVNNEKDNYENSRWYKLYKKHMEVTSVFISHRDYLLCRDMNVATVVMSIAYIGTVYLTPISYNCKSMGFLVIMYIVTRHAAINKAKKFVLNVIASDIHENQKDKED